MHLKTASFSACAACFCIFFAIQHTGKAEQGVLLKKTIGFSGHDWKIKSSETRVGPGSNYFSDSKENVWVDNAGQLHLKIAKNDGQWHCAEIISQESFGFGTYCFHIATPLTQLDPNITLGLFTWSDRPEHAHREIDIECSKWGKASDTNNAQFVVQPYQLRGRLLRYHVPEDLENSIYAFTWETNDVHFSCIDKSSFSSEITNTPICEWKFSKNSIPQPGDENIRINLWLCAGRGPRDTNKTEIIISKFKFTPSK